VAGGDQRLGQWAARGAGGAGKQDSQVSSWIRGNGMDVEAFASGDEPAPDVAMGRSS